MIAQENQASSEFAQASRKSLGLSATLDVDKISDSRNRTDSNPSTGKLMLAGSLFGLIVWLHTDQLDQPSGES